ncbi:MAG: Na/Pi cotransporter family protein, partial [Treponema sp.]|nr:Na/Pi cotransporter family protein [Treponema sp.]
MEYAGIFFSIAGSLGLFLYGMKVMSDGIQQAAGQRMQKALSFMTGNRLSAVLTGFGVTAIIQSSSATTVMVVSFVNAGLLTLTQAIGVIMGANIGTTVTAWIVSIIGFSLKLGALALPAVGIGFIMSMIKWNKGKYRELGMTVLGFGLLFMGLDLLTKSMPRLSPAALEFIASFSGRGLVSMLLGALVGLGITLLIHSSSAATAIFLTMAHQGMVNYEMAAAMILGANIGTTVDAALASIGAKSAARRAALVHVLFNVIGTIWALAFFRPLLSLVDAVTPGLPEGMGITGHLAMLHTVFNTVNTLLFFPFVNQFAALVSRMIPERDDEPSRRYTLSYHSGSFQDTPELNILRAEQEIRDMAGLVSAMYAEACGALTDLASDPEEGGKSAGGRTDRVDALVASMKERETYSDEMREELTRFLIECTRQQLSPQSEYNISQLLRIIADLEDMADDCCGISMILERSVKKDQLFKRKEMEALAPYVKQVEDFLSFVREHLGHPLNKNQVEYAELIEGQIDRARNKLRKMGRKRIEAGADVKTELLFMDLVRRIELLGDFCYNIS